MGNNVEAYEIIQEMSRNGGKYISPFIHKKAEENGKEEWK